MTRCPVCRDECCPGCDIPDDDGYEPDYAAILADRADAFAHRADWPEPVDPVGNTIP